MSLWSLFPGLSMFISCGFYYVLWHNPEVWIRFSDPRDPCEAMSRGSFLIKMIQYGSALTIISITPDYPLWVYLLELMLILVGQYLNYRVYALLGMDGVYYGTRFGKNIPWVTEFPYSHMSDPQYIGCILTVLGIAIFMPWHFTVLGVISYLVNIKIESQVPETKKQRVKSIKD